MGSLRAASELCDAFVHLLCFANCPNAEVREHVEMDADDAMDAQERNADCDEDDVVKVAAVHAVGEVADEAEEDALSFIPNVSLTIKVKLYCLDCSNRKNAC